MSERFLGPFFAYLEKWREKTPGGAGKK